MGNKNRRFSLRERFAEFMVGRYGIDRLYYFLLAVCFILIVINLFANSYIISVIESGLFFFALYRVLSRNVYKRQKENLAFLNFMKKPKKQLNLIKCKFRDRKTHGA